MTEPWKKKESHQPDFCQMLKVLNKEKPERPVLYEISLNDSIYKEYGNIPIDRDLEKVDFKTRYEVYMPAVIKSFEDLGYDYANTDLYNFEFPKNRIHREKTFSLNEGAVITDRESFEKYNWPDPCKAKFVPDDFIMRVLPEGMKLIPLGPGGVLETLIALVGFDNLCFLLADNPGLVKDIIDAIGSRILKLYKILLKYESVGAIVSNDDWGFKTQTMLSPGDLQKYIFPWHKKIVETSHKNSKPVILHSCGNFSEIMDSVVYGIKFDAKHSYEDTILPVEKAYDNWVGRIAIMGGIDVDFLCRSTPEAIYKRSKDMLERTKDKGGYALGSGNSIPQYIPRENYLAMISAAWE